MTALDNSPAHTPRNPRTPRVQMHRRTICCEGFARDDQLWDIEATLIDTKFQSFHNHERGEILPGEPIHNMKLTLTVDLDLCIHAVAVAMPYTPFGVCKTAGIAMDELVGMTIGPGWLAQVRQRIARTESCTHIVELLAPLATTAYQTMHVALAAREAPTDQPPKILDQCLALARTSPVVKAVWPQFYRGKSEGARDDKSDDKNNDKKRMKSSNKTRNKTNE